MSALVPCPGCHRHVRNDTASCPFCAMTITAHATPVPPMRRRGRRTEILLFATTLATAGCGGAVEEPKTDAATDAPADTSVWDVADPDTFIPTPDVGESDGAPVPIYGAAPWK